MIFAILLKTLNGVCCLSFYEDVLIVAYVSGLISMGSLHLQLPGKPACVDGAYVVALTGDKVRLFMLSPKGIVPLVDAGFVPDECRSSARFVALVKRGEVALVYDLLTNVTYIMNNVTIVEPLDDGLIVVRGSAVDVHREGGGFTISLSFVPNDVAYRNGTLYFCSEDGVYAYEEAFRKLLDEGCQRISIDRFAVLSQETKVVVYLQWRPIAVFSYEKVVREVATRGGDVALLVNGVLYLYRIVQVEDHIILTVVAAPVVISFIDMIIRKLRD